MVKPSLCPFKAVLGSFKEPVFESAAVHLSASSSSHLAWFWKDCVEFVGYSQSERTASIVSQKAFCF